MEIEGLQRVLKFMDEQKLTVDTLVTDTHRLISGLKKLTHRLLITLTFGMWLKVL